MVKIRCLKCRSWSAELAQVTKNMHIARLLFYCPFCDVCFEKETPIESNIQERIVKPRRIGIPRPRLAKA